MFIALQVMFANLYIEEYYPPLLVNIDNNFWLNIILDNLLLLCICPPNVWILI